MLYGDISGRVGGAPTPTLVDSFEVGNLSNYTDDNSGMDVVTGATAGISAQDGTHILRAQEGTASFSKIYSTEASGTLPYYPQKGDYIDLWVRGSKSRGMNNLLFALSDSTPGSDNYEIRCDRRFSNFAISIRENGSRSVLSSESHAFSPGVWRRVRITWDDGTLGGSDNELSAELFDASGTSLLTVGPVTDSTFATNRGIGFSASDQSAGSLYYDYITATTP